MEESVPRKAANGKSGDSDQSFAEPKPRNTQPSQHNRPRLVGIGLFASGTTSLARVFGGFNAAFEMWPVASMAAIVADRRGAASVHLRDFVRRRLAVGLDVDSAGYNWYYAELMARMDPSTKFVLLVRHPLDWIETMMNKFSRNRILHRAWARAYCAEFMEDKLGIEALLERHSALSGMMRGAIRHWTDVNRQMLSSLPPQRRLVIPTDALSRELDRIAAFADVAPELLRHTASRSNVDPGKCQLLSPDQRQVLWNELQRDAQDLMSAELAGAWQPEGIAPT